MKKLRFLLAILLARSGTLLMRLFGYKATHTPGAIALKLCPDFLSHLARPKTVLAITGTNGKTTTSNLLAGVLSHAGRDFAHNGYGSNIKEGVITTLMEASSFWGGPKKDLCILEIDERASRIIFPELAPDYLIVTNLFRESYLRNAHAEFVFRVLNDHIPASTTLILNADDPLSSRLGQANKKVYFSLAQQQREASQEHSLIQDLPLCPSCHHPITYSFRRYHHIGHVHCEHCSFTNPKADVVLETIGEQDLHVLYNKQEEVYPLLGDNLMDTYNELAVISLLRSMGMDKDALAEYLAPLQVVKSRKDVQEVEGITLYRMLAKGMNPIAISRAIDSILSHPGRKSVILLNDTSTKKRNHEENTAWLYDTDFEQLLSPEVKEILIGGYRAKDYALRLELAGIPSEKIILCEEKIDVAKQINLEDVDLIGILYELYSEPVSREIREVIAKRLQEKQA